MRFGNSTLIGVCFDNNYSSSKSEQQWVQTNTLNINLNRFFQINLCNFLIIISVIINGFIKPLHSVMTYKLLKPAGIDNSLIFASLEVSLFVHTTTCLSHPSSGSYWYSIGYQLSSIAPHTMYK